MIGQHCGGTHEHGRHYWGSLQAHACPGSRGSRGEKALPYKIGDTIAVADPGGGPTFVVTVLDIQPEGACQRLTVRTEVDSPSGPWYVLPTYDLNSWRIEGSGDGPAPDEDRP